VGREHSIIVIDRVIMGCWSDQKTAAIDSMVRDQWKSVDVMKYLDPWSRLVSYIVY